MKIIDFSLTQLMCLELPLKTQRTFVPWLIHRQQHALRSIEGRSGILVASHPSLADVALMPFVRQFAHVDREWFGQTPYLRLQAWLQRLLASDLFTSIMKK